ncbi:MAG: hypothetical protein ACREUW_12265 [Burkholderiales bacterium]
MAGTRRLARQQYQGRGTRFLLYPQPPVLQSILGPETVWIAHPPDAIGPGPADDRMYVVDAVGKEPYREFPHAPPYRGARRPPVQPGPDGHFDHLTDPWSREFMAAHMYGTLRFVLDVWERYFGGPLPWHFAGDLPRLELVPLVNWNNAHSGYGFIETGFARPDAPEPQPFCLNFDVLAHELGHAFIYALLGTPPPGRAGAEYFAFHESAADCVAMIAVLDFDSVVDRLLERTCGNLYLPNELNRIGELSETEQIRLASTTLTLADVPDLRTPPAQLSYPQRHTMSLPMTGAVFDMLVDVFQHLLVQDRLISRELDALSRPDVRIADEATVQAEFDHAYAGRHDDFKNALLDARDYIGRCLAAAWRTLSWDVTYAQAGAALLAADQQITGGAGREIMLESLRWRGIELPFRTGRHTFSERVAAMRPEKG